MGSVFVRKLEPLKVMFRICVEEVLAGDTFGVRGTVVESAGGGFDGGLILKKREFERPLLPAPEAGFTV